MTPTLGRDRVWAAIDAQRLRIAELLDDLTDDEWRQPSLCEGWTVHDFPQCGTQPAATVGRRQPVEPRLGLCAAQYVRKSGASGIGVAEVDRSPGVQARNGRPVTCLSAR